MQCLTVYTTVTLFYYFFFYWSWCNGFHFLLIIEPTFYLNFHFTYLLYNIIEPYWCIWGKLEDFPDGTILNDNV